MTDDPIPATATVTAPNGWDLSLPITELTLTPEASEALSRADHAVQQATATRDHAQALRDAILTGIVASAGIRGGQVVQVKAGPPMVLVLQLSGAG